MVSCTAAKRRYLRALRASRETVQNTMKTSLFRTSIAHFADFYMVWRRSAKRQYLRALLALGRNLSENGSWRPGSRP